MDTTIVPVPYAKFLLRDVNADLKNVEQYG